MISESLEEQASLYALGLLDADEADAFERDLHADGVLRAFVREMEETVAQLASAGEQAEQKPPAELKARVLAVANAVGRRPTPSTVAFGGKGLPWAIAALLLGCSGVLLWAYAREWARAGEFHHSTVMYQQLLQGAQAEADRAAALDPLTQVSFCALEPTPDFATAQPRAAVLWDAAHRQGKLRVNRLAPPAEGKDYQLWTVQTGQKEPVSAGVFHVSADGTADVPFQPDGDGQSVVAVAISLEPAGGSPTKQGPILLLGKF